MKKHPKDNWIYSLMVITPEGKLYQTDRTKSSATHLQMIEIIIPESDLLPLP